MFSFYLQSSLFNCLMVENSGRMHLATRKTDYSREAIAPASGVLSAEKTCLNGEMLRAMETEAACASALRLWLRDLLRSRSTEAACLTTFFA